MHDQKDVWNLLEKKKEKIGAKLNGTMVAKDIPQQVYLQYLTLRRELLIKMNALLTQQYEMAKIEEAREELSFQVIDSAEAPEKRFKPKRKQIVMVAFFASIFLAVFLAFFLEYIEKMKAAQMKE